MTFTSYLARKVSSNKIDPKTIAAAQKEPSKNVKVNSEKKTGSVGQFCIPSSNLVPRVAPIRMSKSEKWPWGRGCPSSSPYWDEIIFLLFLLKFIQVLELLSC